MGVTVSPSGDYVDCCICTYDHPLFTANYQTLKYLPIKQTLYLTWGRWAGYLLWDTDPGMSVPSAIWHNSWTGIQTVHFDCWPVRDGYGNCTTQAGDHPVLMALSCSLGLAGYIYDELVIPPTLPFWYGVLGGYYTPGPPYLKYDCDGGFTIEGNAATAAGGPCGEWFNRSCGDDMVSRPGYNPTITLSEA